MSQLRCFTELECLFQFPQLVVDTGGALLVCCLTLGRRASRQKGCEGKLFAAPMNGSTSTTASRCSGEGCGTSMKALITTSTHVSGRRPSSSPSSWRGGAGGISVFRPSDRRDYCICFGQMHRLVLLLAIVGAAYSQMVRQCTCQEFEPCKNSAVGNIMQCADQCQNHVSALGASYPAMRSCLMAQQPMINGAVQCQASQLSGACARGPGGQVPKRYPETLKIAAYSEINSMLARSGVQAEARGFMAAGKKFASCVMRCMERGGGNCFKRLGCGLALPPDNVLVQSAKQCAIRSGFNTPNVQQLCHCIARSGVRNLDPICSRIQIT